jgi:hypothetical protein
MCPDTNYIYKNFDKYCISALFKTGTKVSSVCPIRIIPEKLVIIQTERDKFFIYHSKVIQLHIECGGKPKRIEEFRGVKKVKLAPSCIGYTDAYYIESHQDYSLNYTITFRNTSW